MYKYVPLLLGAAVLAGCSTSRYSQYDEFEKVKVDKMVGNEVKFSLLSRSIVCLNAMREARWPQPQTNVTISFTTNYPVTFVTNITVLSSSNEQLGSSTNATAVSLGQANNTTEGLETNNVITSASAPADATAGGVTISITRNESRSFAPNQSVFSQTVQKTTLVNQQGTVNASNQAMTGATNQAVTIETNVVVTVFTNQVITPVTNITVVSPSQQVFDYFLYTELAPPDFTLQPGESLIVLVDGVRHSFAPSQPQSAWANRPGFLTTFYKVPPEVVVALANSREAKMRIKGASGTLERELSPGSIQNFREFLVGNFGPKKETARSSQVKTNRS